MRYCNCLKGLLVLSAIFFAGNSKISAQDCEQGELILDQNFDQYTDSLIYTTAMANTDFGGVRAYTSGEIRGLDTNWPQTTRVLDGQLRAEYIANAASGRMGGFLFDKEFQPVEAAMLEYKVKFGENFTWATGGKLPGLGGSGLSGNGTMPSGCVSRSSDNSKNGFSCRLMWRTNRAHTAAPKLVVYLYHPNRPKDCGEDVFIIKDIKKGQWYTIRQYVELNTPGKDDGVLKMYVDGKLLVDRNDIQYRLAGKENVKINALIMNTYRGGSATDPVWWSPNTDYAYFDDFKVWSNCNGGASRFDAVEDKLFTVFPNPSHTGVFNLNERRKWHVTDMNGRLIKDGFGDSVDLSNQGPGFYLLKLDNQTLKLVIINS